MKSHQVNLFLAGFGHLKPLCPSSNSNHQTTNASDMSVIIVKKRVELLSKWPSPIVEHARAFGQLKKETEPTLYGQVKNDIIDLLTQGPLWTEH